ncbi:RNA exonuclease 1 homolog isoform X2 [Protopterus annectens]|uniref:RNA exonuclease 1 homolog isoform X2 n=1 Tax=Protopterus annectens TaxID=7888 RepID=UPI001CF9C5DE|nr:RNA exonuclease 1 homolog isoform X2 [Protopterus annectens]
MLRSTGFFRGIECPFSKNRGSGENCSRPYCHFRHNGGDRRVSSSTTSDMVTTTERESSSAEVDCDLYNPEFPNASSSKDNETFEECWEPDSNNLELELVNKAIEAIKDEMEREQKKYEKLLETKKEYQSSLRKNSAGVDDFSVPVSSSVLDYVPNQYEVTSKTEYNPTPLSSTTGNCKYVLDAHNAKSKGKYLEYVPSAVIKASKYTVPVNKNKYVVDKSKPSTDLEYDPLSNYSARHLSKTSKEHVLTKKNKTFIQEDPCLEDAYVPASKKHCGDKSFTGFATDEEFSDSEEELHDQCYLDSSKHKHSCSTEPSGVHTEQKVSNTEKTTLSKVKDSAVQYDAEDFEELQWLEHCGSVKKLTKKTNVEKPKLVTLEKEAGKNELIKFENKDIGKTSETKETRKSKSQSSYVKDKKTVSNKCDLPKGSERLHDTNDKQTALKVKVREDKSFLSSQSMPVSKVKSKSEKNKTSSEIGNRVTKGEKEKNAEKTLKGTNKAVNDIGSFKTVDFKSKSLDETKKEKSIHSISSEIIRKLQSSPLKPGPEKNSSEMKDERHNTLKHGLMEIKARKVESKFSRCTSAEGTSNPVKEKAKPVGKPRTLSHAELFGDESEDEGENGLEVPLPDILSSDSDDEDSENKAETPRQGLASSGPNNDDRCLESPCKPDKFTSGRFMRKSPTVSKSNTDSFTLKKTVKQEKDLHFSALKREKRKELDVEHLYMKRKKVDEESTTKKKIKLVKEMHSSPLLNKDDDDDEFDTMEECLRIFNESKDVKTEDKGRFGKQVSNESTNEVGEDDLKSLFPGQKKRVAHQNSGPAGVASKQVAKPYHHPSPQEVCYQRALWAQKQAEIAAGKAASGLQSRGEKQCVSRMSNHLLSSDKQCIRIAKPVSGASAEKTSVPGSSDSVMERTSSGMLHKTSSTATTQKRLAHTPTLKSTAVKRPVIPAEYGSKVPTNIRQRYLNVFIDECLKFCASDQEAIDRALEEEKAAYDRSSSRVVYLNVAVNTLKKLRNLIPSTSQGSKSTKAVNSKRVSHEAVLGGKLAAKTSFSVGKSVTQQQENLTGANLYRKLKAYVMTEEQLEKNGYPMPHPEKAGRAVILANEEKKASDQLSRICCRCGAEYALSVSGNYVRKEECTYHWGKLRRHRVPGGWETQYSCCSAPVGSQGCQLAKQHVHDGRKENLDGFVKTFAKSLPPDGNAGIFALDCEMCYTKIGLELTRITVINSDLKVVYDTFVKPSNPIVDYNTRFSGVTAEDLEDTTITIHDVQAVLLSMFSEDTILIGHSLESDLFALKLMHKTVVDTAIVFPHRLGLPYKRALRTLTADYLKRIIQDDVGGHDSSEDASSCMQLMIWKLKEDAKVKR